MYSIKYVSKKTFYKKTLTPQNVRFLFQYFLLICPQEGLSQETKTQKCKYLKNEKRNSGEIKNFCFNFEELSNIKTIKCSEIKL